MSQLNFMGFTLKFRVCSITPEPYERVSLNFTQMFPSVSCLQKKTMTESVMQTQSQGSTLISWNPAVLQTAVVLCKMVHKVY